ncbi:globin [Bradyrhizobium zhanjiangense]|uniref:Globin n=2 Tax=Bradyrhizobium zhanjiangense TaxID=1325107 RepID=A0ABY0DD07_9BRAD|nr:globin [Bradyrhizobium zhanjiangense]
MAEAPMKAPPNPIERSFELAASRCADLTPRVYQRLFEEHPETRMMFRSQGSELVMGSMLALAIEAVLDFTDERSGHFRLIACEAASHEAYGTSRDLFIAFFAIIRETLRDLLGDEWSPDIAEAWDALLVAIDAFAGVPA